MTIALQSDLTLETLTSTFTRSFLYGKGLFFLLGKSLSSLCGKDDKRSRHNSR